MSFPVSETSSQHVNRIARRYALYVLNEGRAIPSLYDGLKKVQRIALWIMATMAEAKNVASLAGAMIESELYYHGDASAAGAIQNMAAPFLNNIPYFDAIGAFGTRVNPYGFASPRYTSVKRSKFLKDNMFVDMDTLEMIDNFDGSATLPFSFAPHLPLVLLNGVTGIATAYSTTIFPRSYEAIKKATLEYIQTGKIKTDLAPTFANYDVTVSKITDNKYEIAGRITKLSDTRYRVTEVLPGMALIKLREKLIELSEDVIDPQTGLVKKKAIVDDFIDNSQKKIDVEIKFFPGRLRPNESDMDVMRRLGLVEIITENIVVLDENGVQTLDSPQEVIRRFVEWRLTMYPIRYKKLMDKEKLETLFWQSFLSCLEMSKTRDPIPQILTSVKDKDSLKDAMRGLIIEHGYPVNEDIVERLASLPIHRWTKTGTQECKAKISESLLRHSEYEAILKSPDKQNKIYVDEIKALKV